MIPTHYIGTVHARPIDMAFVRLLTLLLLLSPLAATAGPVRWDRLSAEARQTLILRRGVRDMQKSGAVRTAHPDVARRLSEELSQSLGRTVRLPARRIIQVQWGSPEHQALRRLLAPTIGIGIYPSKTWGHNKLRLGDLVTDSVPGAATPFPSTGTRARIVPFDGMHNRYYEAVFPAADATVVQRSADQARQLVAEKCTSGMNCASFVSKIVRGHVQSTSQTPYSGKLQDLMRSESAAGPLWKKAAGSDPALIIVYTPPGDFRDVRHPGFTFDYALK
jgi:hypothetical protein